MRELLPGENAWGDGARPFRRGDDGWPVVALQVNLNLFGNRLALDGAFGPATEKVARAFQRHRGLVADGVIGPVSQERICRDLAGPEAHRAGLPHDLMRGLLELESSYMLAACTPHPEGDGFDLGALQDAFYDPPSADADDQLGYVLALNVRRMAGVVAAQTRQRHDYYTGNGAADKLGWECAALYHNRPASADRLATGASASTNTGPVRWVEVASGGRLHTIAEWCASYIGKATKYVAW